MNKQELIKKIAEATKLTQKDSGAALDAAIEAIQNSVAAGEKVQLVGFGTFETRKYEARTGRNPRTGEQVEIEATVTPTFKAGKAFKDAVNR